MDKIAGVLLEKEVIDAEEFDRLMNEGTSSDILSKEKPERPANEDTPGNSPSQSQNDTNNPPDTPGIPEMPDTRVDFLPKTGRDFIA